MNLKISTNRQMNLIIIKSLTASIIDNTKSYKFQRSTMSKSMSHTVQVRRRRADQCYRCTAVGDEKKVSNTKKRFNSITYALLFLWLIYQMSIYYYRPSQSFYKITITRIHSVLFCIQKMFKNQFCKFKNKFNHRNQQRIIKTESLLIFLHKVSDILK